MKNSQNEEFEMNVTFWRAMTYRDGANRVRVDVLLKWKWASWKEKGRVFVPPLPKSLDKIKKQNKNSYCQCHCSPFAESLGNLQRRLAITIKNKERHFENVTFWKKILYYSSWIINFRLKFRFYLSKNVYLSMTFTNNKTIQTKTKVFIHLHLIVFDNFSFLSAFTKYRLTHKV